MSQSTMVEVLRADEPLPGLAEKLQLFGQFVGSWDVEVVNSHGWPVEQVANLMPYARFELIEGAAHVIWPSHPEELESLLRTFVGEIIKEG